MINRILAGLCWVVLWLPNLVLQCCKSVFIKGNPNPQREKADVLERADWLAGRLLTDPERLIDRMPSFLGRHYRGEWALYACSHYSAALLNISRLYPEEMGTCLVRMERIIEIVLDPSLRWYDTSQWHEDALESLSGDKSHMTYLSILSWIITNYRLAGGDERFDGTLHACCEALNRRMLRSEDLNLLSFPGAPVYLPDMLFCIAALHNYSLLFSGRYARTVGRWLEKAKGEWLDPKTGLLASKLPGPRRHKRSYQLLGSYTALNCYCLTLIDRDFAQDQYDKMKEYFCKTRPFDGIREYLGWDPTFRFDVDAGPVAFGLSPSGTAWAIGPATFFKDREYRRRWLRTGEIAGVTVRGRRKRHYLLGSIVLVGEAVTLAMKTNGDHE